jgi:hypothetical protein
LPPPVEHVVLRSHFEKMKLQGKINKPRAQSFRNLLHGKICGWTS